MVHRMDDTDSNIGWDDGGCDSGSSCTQRLVSDGDQESKEHLIILVNGLFGSASNW